MGCAGAAGFRHQPEVSLHLLRQNLPVRGSKFLGPPGRVVAGVPAIPEAVAAPTRNQMEMDVGNHLARSFALIAKQIKPFRLRDCQQSLS